MQRTKKILKGLILLAVTASILTVHIVKAQAPELPSVPLADQNIHQIVAYFANQYGTDAKTLDTVMMCESGGKQDTSSDHTLSNGIFQIQRETWKRFTKEMGETLNYNSPMDQAKVAAFAFAHGHSNEWTTYVSLMHGGSYTFYYKLEKRMYTVYCK